MVQKLPPLDVRIPKWNHDDLTERICPICSSPDAGTAYERPDNLYIRLCKKCNTFFVSPCPSNEQLHSFYEFYDEKHRPATRLKAKELATSYKATDPFADLRIRELNSYLNFGASRVLDIGFGRANFLFCLKKLGAIPYGIELDPQAIEFAQYLGITNVFQGKVEDFVCETKFDLITLIDLIEHPIDPLDLLRKSSELLQPGGFLLIWTPNGDFGHLEKHKTSFRVDLEHMQYLTPDSCIFIASELKLRVAHLETLGFPGLEGIDKPFSKDETKARHLKKFFKSVPGFSALNSFRHKLFVKERDYRGGRYHLFCILQKHA